MSNSPKPERSRDLLKPLFGSKQSERQSQPDWPAHESAEILQHLLDTKLTSDLERFAELSGDPQALVKTELATLGQLTYAQALLQPGAPRAVLTRIKDLAKTSVATGQDLPPEVARLLYAMTLRRSALEGHSISSLKPSATQALMARCLTVQWLPDPVRALLRDPQERT